MAQAKPADRLFGSDSPSAMGEPYSPAHLTRAIHIADNGTVDLSLCIYFPGESSGEGDRTLQVKVGSRPWQAIAPGENGYWSLEVNRLVPGTPLRFRYRNGNGKWHPFAPFTHLERVYEVTYVPKLNYPWKHEPPQYNHGRILMETTLEGLLAGYEGGVFAPRSREEMFRNAIAQQMLRTASLDRLAELGIDGILVPTCSSVADRAHLNPRFNYLTYDVADVDWQLGATWDFMRLVDALYDKGLALVPDLTFAHQVKAPFPGSLDEVRDPKTQAFPFVDTQAFAFRDRGTWMFKLEDPHLRRQIVEKIVAFATRYHLTILRLGYLDGLISQYAQREVNYGELLLQELKAELHQVAPDITLVGEAFAVKDNPTVKECIDIFYAPYGFPIAEELYKPPAKRQRPLCPDFDRLMPALQRAVECQRQNAVYAQLHDEICQDDLYAQDRPDVPWAYGSNPAELAKVQGEALVAAGLLPQEDLLDYVRRTVRSTEALTMFAAKLMYLFVPAVDSLFLGCSDTQDNWKFHWDDVTPEQLAFWEEKGLSDRQIYLLHKQHRLDMARLRQIFRVYTIVMPETLEPATEVSIHHIDGDRAVLALWRYNSASPYESLLIVFNLGATAHKPLEGEKNILEPGCDLSNKHYKFPLPQGFGMQWEVLFDGDWIDPLLRASDRSYYLDTNEAAIAYAPGTIVSACSSTQASETTAEVDIIHLPLGAFSLMVLKPHR